MNTQTPIPTRAPAEAPIDDIILPFEVAALDLRGRVVRLGPAVDTILAGPALAPLAALRAERMLDVPEPRHAVLVSAVAGARAVSVLVRNS